MRGEPFDADYYSRYYGDRDTRVTDLREIRKLARFVLSYLGFLSLSPRSALDLGCGIGLWKKALSGLSPSLRYTGVEISDYLCRRLGWEKGSVVDWAPGPTGKAGPGRRFDLVICQGVLQYLEPRQAEAAIANLARLTGKALYLEALTREDWAENCDQSVTDGNMELRPAAWYRKRLGRHFQNCGGGLFIPREAGVSLFELEKGA